MDYRKAERYLLDIPRFAGKNTLEDTKAALKMLGNPERAKTVIHVAGTNGKGSVCAYLSSVLRRAGYLVGTFTSPHLVSMRERFVLDGQMIDEAQFVRIFQWVRARLAEGIPGKRAYHPSFFEMLFLMAMRYFEEGNAQVIVLETGLGGRLDATNSVSRKDLCIITEIGMDHMEYLGSTIAEIAWEKAGIISPGVPIVYADRKKEASRVILGRASALGAPAFPVSKSGVRNLEIRKNSIDFSYNTRYYGYVRCMLSTCAPYQAENAALALEALDVLAGKLPVERDLLMTGLREARWEGRMEEILAGVYVDGAHNVDGITAFLEAVRPDHCEGHRYLLFSAVGDKQYETMAGLLTESDLFDEFYVTKLENTRGVSLEALEAAFCGAGARNVFALPYAQRAYEAVLQRKRAEDRVYITGSLYLVGEIKGHLKGDRHDQF